MKSTTPTPTTTTTTTIPEPKYRRLDFAKLPPFRLERIPAAELKKTIPGWGFGCPIRFKNIWDHEKEAKDASDKEKTDMARTVTRRTQTKSTKMRRPFCKFCMQRKLPLKDCKTHFTKSGPEFGSKITCPVLLQQQCARCGEIGHTPKYCKSDEWLNTDPCQISSYRDPLSFEWFNLESIADARIPFWQKPIPPALQKRHEEYEEKCVKPSRIWIEMTGDHKQYTNDFRIVMMVSKKDDWFDITPRTEYEDRVQSHYEWMRTVQWDETRQTNCGDFFFVNSPPPSYEEATVAAKELLQNTEAEKAEVDDAATTTTAFERDSKQVMRNIIMKYLEHQSR
jgi:RNase P subunit RPR2